MNLHVYLFLLMHVFCAIDGHIYAASSHSRGKELPASMFCPLEIAYMKLYDTISPHFSLFE